VPPDVTEFMAKWGRKGGKARARNMSEADRKAASGRGGAARWANMTADERARALAKMRAGRAKKRKS
jgi:hypothetical protein